MLDIDNPKAMSGLNNDVHIDELIEAENVVNQDEGNESESLKIEVMNIRFNSISLLCNI